ncbi:MAG: STAS/SEC14 domain-containing protein [Bacteroidales bacterium]|nr:STAS/SEC14 domain-containing protein [Bacteroidales bacterium]
MNKEVILENDFGAAVYDRDNMLIEISFDGRVNVDSMKSIYIKSMSFMETNPTKGLVNDLSKMTGTFTKLNEWILTDMRSTYDLGLRKSALIVSDDIFTEFAAQDLQNKAQLVEFKIFKHSNEALEWVK